MSISSVYCIPSYTDTSCEYSTDVPLFIPLCRTATSSPIHRPAALLAKTTPYVSTPLNPSSPSSHSLPPSLTLTIYTRSMISSLPRYFRTTSTFANRPCVLPASARACANICVVRPRPHRRQLYKQPDSSVVVFRPPGYLDLRRGISARLFHV